MSRAFPFFNGNFVVGVTGRYSRGTTGIKEESAFTTDIGKLSNFVRRGTTGNERTKSRYSYDVGAVINIGALRLGGVMNGVNRPQYPFNDDAAPEIAARRSSWDSSRGSAPPSRSRASGCGSRPTST